MGEGGGEVEGERECKGEGEGEGDGGGYLQERLDCKYRLEPRRRERGIAFEEGLT